MRVPTAGRRCLVPGMCTGADLRTTVDRAALRALGRPCPGMFSLGRGARACPLLVDAGRPVGAFGNPPELCRNALPLYAELKRSEVAYAEDHLRHGIPDLRLATLPDRHTDLALRRDLPVTDTAARHLLGFRRQCADLSSRGVSETLQHDDLHMANPPRRRPEAFHGWAVVVPPGDRSAGRGADLSVTQPLSRETKRMDLLDRPVIYVDIPPGMVPVGLDEKEASDADIRAVCDAVPGPAGVPVVRLGRPLLDGYLEFLSGRWLPNTVLAVAFDLESSSLS